MLVRRGRNFVRIRKYIFEESCAQHEKANIEKKSNVPTFFLYLDFVTHTFINFWFYLDDACLVSKKWCIHFSFSLFYIQINKKILNLNIEKSFTESTFLYLFLRSILMFLMISFVMFEQQWYHLLCLSNILLDTLNPT